MLLIQWAKQCSKFQKLTPKRQYINLQPIEEPLNKGACVGLMCKEDLWGVNRALKGATS